MGDMNNPLEFTPSRKASGDDYFGRQLEPTQDPYALVDQGAHELDGEEARKAHTQLLEWYYLEKDRQSLNRLDMAMDADFYDNLQWNPDDSAILKDRGQMPLVYNEVAPMCDWLIGTERRARVDWRVLPRREEEIALADVKTKVMKYTSDVNHSAFARSRAFADAVKVGVGWVDDGVRDDPTQDAIYSKYEDWRNVLWDSMSYELDLSDARYLFRWRWVDEDVALMMFPDRLNAIREGVEESTKHMTDSWAEDTWYSAADLMANKAGVLYASGTGATSQARRRRIKLIECQFRMPAKAQIVDDGPLKGAFFNKNDKAMADVVARHGSRIVERVMMRMHIAVFTESKLLSLDESMFRHNKFSLTPIWAYRRSRDRMPYGAIRRVRDMQQDLNKRASKALFLLNTNQIIADEGAVADWDEARDEVDRPDGTIVKKQGKEFSIRRDADAATGQIQMMTLAAQSIQKSAGVSQENMGRQTNAVSGEAIKARQMQGSVVTTEFFDNLRYATQVQGEKVLSLVEQWYTEEKVVRLTGAKGALDWVKINQPEVQPDGSVRWLNDITASCADFVVSEQDYSGTLRQVMFDSLNQLATRLPPEVSLRLMTIAMDFSDMPNKDEVTDAIRKMTGERDETKEMTPEEKQAQEQQAQQQAEALQIQRETAITALEEQKAKVNEINARAQKLQAEAQSMGAQGAGGQEQVNAAVAQIRQQASDEIDAMSEKLRKMQSDLANQTLKINREADTQVEVARIQAAAATQAAEIQSSSDERIAVIQKRLEAVTKAMAARADLGGLSKELAKSPEHLGNYAQTEAGVEAVEPKAAEPISINVTVQPQKAQATAKLEIIKDVEGNIIGAKAVNDKGEAVKSVSIQRDKDGEIVGGQVTNAEDESEQ